MTPRDAINLLIAAAGSSRVKDSVRLVQQHGACRTEGKSWDLSFDGLPELRVLGAQHTFADALEALLHGALTGSVDVATGYLNQGVSSGALYPPALAIEVEIREPFAQADITVGIHSFDEDRAATIESRTVRRYEHIMEVDGSFHPPFEAPSLGDLTHIHMFSEKAIYRIAQEFLGS